MNVSHEKKLIFVHIPKCGGTTIKTFLKTRLEGHGHRWASEIQRAHPCLWSEYTTLCCVRNPWDMEVSMFFNRLGVPGFGGPEDHTLTAVRGFAQSLRLGQRWPLPPSGVSQWVGERNPSEKSLMNYITDRKGKIIVNEIIRQENLEVELETFYKKYCPTLAAPAPLRSYNRIPHLPYQDYYSEQWMIDCVAERNQDYIEHFGYEFDS